MIYSLHIIPAPPYRIMSLNLLFVNKFNRFYVIQILVDVLRGTI